MYPEPRPLHIKGHLIRIDIDPEQLVRGVTAELPIAADSRLTLEAMQSALKTLKKTVRQLSGATRAAAIRGATAKLWWPAVALHHKIAGIVLENLPDAILVGDQTEPIYALNQCFEAPRPRSYFNSSTGYGTLGFALPAAIGAKLAAPNRPVVVLVGDGGLQFSIAELASAVEAETPLVLLLWNNQGYGEIKTYMLEKQITPIGVDIFTPDFLTIAKGFGWAATRPASFEELTLDLQKAANRKGPTLIELQAGAPFLRAQACGQPLSAGSRTQSSA